MKPTIMPATSEADREAIYRLRYDIYVEEMNRYGSIADHHGRRLIEPDDARSRLYVARDGDRVVGTMRLTWGGDGPFTDRLVDQYDLAPFLAEVPAEQVIIGERFMVAKDYRGTDLIFRLFCTLVEFVNERRIQLMFGDSEPHLLNLYQGMGFRTYTTKNVNSAEAGYLIPLIMVTEDAAYLRDIGSPLAEVFTDFGGDAQVPDCVARLLARGSAVLSAHQSAVDSYRSVIESSLGLAEAPVTLFDGLSEEQVQRCIGKSNVIACRRGDRIIKQGNVAQNMYVVLSGTLEIRDGERLVSVSGAGDIIGEVAFLLESPRSMDVYAVTDDTRVLSLSERTVKQIIDDDSEAAARLLLNVAKMLCYKLVRKA